MAYQSNIPQSTDLLKNSQADILGNFAALVSFGNGYADFPVQASQPPTLPLASANDSALYTFVNPTTAVNELYVQKQINGGQAQIPMTASKMSASTYAASVNGWSYLPSGMLIKWGTVAATTASVAITPTVTSGGPNFQQVFTAMVTGYDSSVAVNFTCGQNTVPNNTSGNFTAYTNNATATTHIVYLVLGV